MTTQPQSPSEQEIRQQLARIEHERWSDWQAWCHKILRENCPSPELEKVLERWDRQIALDYNQLSEQEKASDMEQVDRYWPLVAQAADKREQEVLDKLVAPIGNAELTDYDVADRVYQRRYELRQGRAAEGEGKNA